MKKLIIEKSSLSPLHNRIGWAFFTACFWIVWVYLWMPLVTLFLWWLGFGFFDKYFLHISVSELADFEQLLIFYSIVVAFLAGSLLTWAGLEFLRFRNIHKRHRPLPVEKAEIAEFVKIPTAKLDELSVARRIIVHHDDHGKFVNAEIG